MSSSNNQNDDGDDRTAASVSSSSPVDPNRSLFADDDDTVIYTTEDGVEILPEWETSVLMALDFERQIQLAKANPKSINQDEIVKQQQAQQQSTSSSSSAVDVTKLLAELEQLTAAAAAEIFAERKRFEDEEQQQHEEGDEEEEEEEDESFEGADEDSAMEGMLRSSSAVGMERNETDPAQWKLESILLRKSVLVQYGDDAIDAEVEDDDPQVVGHSSTKKAKATKEFSYLCKWAPGGRCTTWELRSLLLEEGFGPQVDAYDLKIKEKGKTEAKERSYFKGPCPYRSKRGETKPFDRVTRKPKPPAEKYYPPAKNLQTPLESHRLFFEQLFPNMRKDIQKEAIATRFVIRRIVNIAPEGPAVKLMEVLRSHTNWARGLLYHGTSSTSIKPIMDNGLLVPGKDDNGLRVANGSAHGVAIYTATNLAFSSSYCRGCDKMFVCVGITESSISYVNSSIHTFTNEAYVCPVWMIQFQQLDPLFPQLHLQNCYAEFDLDKIRKKLDDFQMEYFYNLADFSKAPPQPNVLDDIIQEGVALVNARNQLVAARQVVANATPKTAKQSKKISRSNRRVLAIRSGVEIEKA